MSILRFTAIGSECQNIYFLQHSFLPLPKRLFSHNLDLATENVIIFTVCEVIIMTYKTTNG